MKTMARKKREATCKRKRKYETKKDAKEIDVKMGRKIFTT